MDTKLALLAALVGCGPPHPKNGPGGDPPTRADASAPAAPSQEASAPPDVTTPPPASAAPAGPSAGPSAGPTASPAPPVDTEARPPITAHELGLTCAELGAIDTRGVCVGRMRERDGGFAPIYRIGPAVCAKIAEKNISLHADILRSVDGETPATEARIRELATKERAWWAKRCSGKVLLQVWKDRFECLMVAESPADAICGELIVE